MLFFILYQIGSLLAVTLPVKAAYRMAALVADIKYLLSPSEKWEIIENLKLVLPGTDLKSLKRCTRQIFINFSMYLVDFLRFEKLDLKYINAHVEVVGRNYIDEALKKGNGAIIVSAHLGSWELGGAVMGVLGYPTNVIALDHKNKFVNNFFVNQRKRNNEHVISIGAALKKCFVALKNNELLAILGDKDFTNNGVIVKFFGRDTLLPKGPAVFSLRTNAAIISAFVIREYSDKFKLIFGKPVEYQATGNFDEDVKNLTQRCSRILEDNIRRHPAQWYCFRRFWQE